MSDPARIIIFDTTLRDGEQAPGFSMDVPTKVTMARALDALGVDIIEAGFPIASPADSEAVRQIADEVRRPVIAALARTPAAGHRGGGARARAGRAVAHSHVSRHVRSAPDAQAAHVRATNASSRRSTPSRLARSFTDDVEFSAEDATRSDRDFLCRVIEAVIAAGCTTVNLPDTVGYATPDEHPRVLRRASSSRVPNADKRRLQRALPRRSRAGRRQQPGGDSGRRAAGRVHDQRHRRARRQRLARRDRHGAARAAGSPAVRHRHSDPTGLFEREPAAVAGSRANRCRRTRPSSAATRSRTRPASTRTAC